MAKEVRLGAQRLERRLKWLKEREPELFEKASQRLEEEFKPAHVKSAETKAKKSRPKGRGSWSKPELKLAKQNCQTVVATYIDEFKRRYKTGPVLSGRALGQIKNVVKDLGVERTENLLRTYVWMNKNWFTQKMHSIDVFVTSLNEVAVAHDTGNVVTRRASDTMESVDATARAAENYLQEGATSGS